jgi:TPR repeat protein
MFRVLFAIVLMFPLLAQAWEDLSQLEVPASRGLAANERDTFNQAVTAMVNGQQGRARQLLTPLATSGITDAQVALGTLLSRFPAEADKKESAQWLYFSAQAGVWHSQVEVARAYRKGKYAEKNLLTAHQWLNKALPMGGVDVLEEMDDLGKEMMDHAQHLLKQKHTGRAVELMTAVAESGSLQAQLAMAKIYAKPPATKQRKEKMRMWYAKAAAQGSRKAQFSLAKSYLADKSATPADRQHAVALLHQAADPGEAEAQYQLGMMYMRGDGVAKNEEKGLQYYRVAAEQGHEEAQYSLGVRHAVGKGVEVDDYEAHRWFKRAANEGHGKAQHNLALTYLHGMGTKEQPDKANEWFHKAADKGVAKSADYLSGNKLVISAVDEVQPKMVTMREDDAPVQAKAAGSWVESLHGDTWFNKLPAKGYTVQVISGTRKQGVLDFIQRHKLDRGEYYHYVSHKNDKSRHVVQWGYFKTYNDAKKAAIRVSKGYSRFKPWIRKINVVRKGLQS